MKRTFLLLALALPVMAFAKTGTVTSPDGKVLVTVNDDNGIPTYKVDYNGVRFLNPSPLGLKTNLGDFTSSLDLKGTSDVKTLDVKYQLPNIKKSDVDHKANVRIFTFARNGKDAFDVIFHVSDNDIAFRYQMKKQDWTLCCIVSEETTGFAMPSGTTSFLCPQSKPMQGFGASSPSYETNYDLDQATGKNG